MFEPDLNDGLFPRRKLFIMKLSMIGLFSILRLLMLVGNSFIWGLGPIRLIKLATLP